MKGRFVIAALLALLVAGCGDSSAEGARERAERAVPVAAALVQREDVVVTGTYPGELVADAADLAPRVSGRVLEVLVRIGDRVAQGQVLARLDDETLVHEAAEARAQLEVADATLERARTDAALAARELARLEPLVDRELVSAQEIDAARAKSEGLEADVVVAEARRSEARARVARLEQSVRDARLVSPWDGVVAERYLDPGAMVSAGTPIVRVVEDGPLRVRFRIPEQDLARVEVGSALSLAAGGGSEEVGGTVERISGEVSREDRSVAVEGRLPEQGRLLPGMFATVKVDLQVLEDALVVPGAAVVDRSANEGKGGMGVFSPADGKARWVSIDVLGRSGDQVAVAANLEVGQQVLVLGHQGLKDGSAVRVVEVGAP